MSEVDIVSSTGTSTLVNYAGTFNMFAGKISNNAYMGISLISVINIMGGEFNLTGGSIENNEGMKLVEVFNGNFSMSGGSISNNITSTAVYISIMGQFTMSGGEISNNSGRVFEIYTPITLSDFASISGKDGETP